MPVYIQQDASQQEPGEGAGNTAEWQAGLGGLVQAVICPGTALYGFHVLQE